MLDNPPNCWAVQSEEFSVFQLQADGGVLGNIGHETIEKYIDDIVNKRILVANIYPLLLNKKETSTSMYIRVQADVRK